MRVQAAASFSNSNARPLPVALGAVVLLDWPSTRGLQVGRLKFEFEWRVRRKMKNKAASLMGAARALRPRQMGPKGCESECAAKRYSGRAEFRRPSTGRTH